MRIIVPYTPGGVSDITARLIAEPLAAAWGQPVPVENRARADGVIGTEVVARSPADGYTLGLVSVGHPVVRGLLPAALRHHARLHLRDADHLDAAVLCAPRAFAPNTPAELVDYAKRNPGVTFAGTGGVVRLAPCCSRSAQESPWNTCPIAAAPRRIPT